MSSSTKYTPAPQRDSFEQSGYSQAPPSYDATATTDNDALLGGPRSSEDNIPDDFKVGEDGNHAGASVLMILV